MKSSVSAKLRGLGDFGKHAALCLSMLSAERMILFPMCGGTGSDLTAGDTADLLLCEEFDAAFRKCEQVFVSFQGSSFSIEINVKGKVSIFRCFCMFLPFLSLAV